MTTRQFAFVACRILALSTLVRALAITNAALFSLIHTITQYRGADGLTMLLSLVSYPILLYGASIFLWFGAEGLSGRMTRGREEERSGIHLDSQELQVIACSVVGVIILSTVIPDIFGDLPRLITQNYGLSGSTMYKLQTTLWIAEKLVRLTLGTYLLLGSRGFVRFIASIRTAGIKIEDDQTTKKFYTEEPDRVEGPE